MGWLLHVPRVFLAHTIAIGWGTQWWKSDGCTLYLDIVGQEDTALEKQC